MKIAVTINEGPYQHQASDSAYLFCRAALEKGHEIRRVFFYNDGVNNASSLTEPPLDIAAGVKPGELEAMFRPDETELVAAVAKGLKRHSPRRRRQILEALAAFVGADEDE